MSGRCDVPCERLFLHGDVDGLAVLERCLAVLRCDVISYALILHRNLEVTDGKVAQPCELELVFKCPGDFLLFNGRTAYEHLVRIEHRHLDRGNDHLHGTYLRHFESRTSFPLCNYAIFECKLLVYRQSPSFRSPCVELFHGKALAELARIHICPYHCLGTEVISEDIQFGLIRNHIVFAHIPGFSPTEGNCIFLQVFLQKHDIFRRCRKCQFFLYRCDIMVSRIPLAGHDCCRSGKH